MRITIFAMLLALAASTAAVRADDTQDVKEVDEQWAAAEVAHDQAFLEHLLDDRFIATSSSGSRVGKERYIAGAMKNTSMKAGLVSYDAIDLYGDTAVVLETFTDQAHKAGHTRSYSTTFTVVYVRRDGAWHAVAEQWSAPQQI